MKRSAKFLSGPRGWSILLCLAAGVPAQAADSDQQDHRSIRQRAVAYVNAQAHRFPVPPRVEAGQLDSRLQLPRCDRPLEAFESPGGLAAGRSVVGVRCSGSRPWKLYVPVMVALPAQVIALARPMRRGELISEADLTRREADLAELRGQYYSDPAELVGYRIKRNLAAGLPLTPAMIDARRLVRRGSEVTILSDSGSVEVRMQGKSLGQGGRGDRIEVKNIRSGRVVTATVIGRDLVRVTD